LEGLGEADSLFFRRAFACFQLTEMKFQHEVKRYCC